MPTVGKLRYLEAPSQGERPRGALVLLHAFPLNARMWEGQLELAERAGASIAPHLRGFDGATEDPPASSVDDYAADVIDLLDTLHIHEAVVGGLSMGGYVAFAMFRHAPRYFQGLILADTDLRPTRRRASKARKRMLQLVEDKGTGGGCRRNDSEAAGRNDAANRPSRRPRSGSCDVESAAAIAGALRALMTRPIRRLCCDDSLSCADHRRRRRHRDAACAYRRAAPRYRRIRAVVIPAAGHLSNLEQPVAFNAALARFLTIGYSRRMRFTMGC